MPYQKIGVVLVPGAFSDETETKRAENNLRTCDYDVEVADIYTEQRRPWQMKMPRWFSVVVSLAIMETIFAERFDYNWSNSAIQNAIWALKGRGCLKIVVLGYGMGATAALKHGTWGTVREVVGIIAYEPILVFLPGNDQPPPDLTKVLRPTLLIYGWGDEDLAVSKQEATKATYASQGKIRYAFVSDANEPTKVGHGFAARTLRGRPNPAYHQSAEETAWQSVRDAIRKWCSDEVSSST